MKYKFVSCSKDYSINLDEKFKKWFKNTFKFSNNDINKFIFYWEKVFILMSTWMNGKSFLKQHNLTKKDFIAT